MLKDKLVEMLKKKKAGGHELSETDKSAKMNVLDDLKSHAQDMMGDQMKGLKKVTVASPTKEGVEHGLDKAKEILHNVPFEDKDEIQGDDADTESDYEEPDTESDSDESEVDQHTPDAEPEDKGAHDHLDEHQLDAKIQELMALKEKKQGSLY